MVFRFAIYLLIPFLLSLSEAEKKLWYDGQAELSGYALKFNRYGGQRDGTAVAIFVTEAFNNKTLVKSDLANGAHVETVVKLNLVEDFATGIYDYNLMTSVFVPFGTETAAPVFKISFGSQEWCGQTYTQILRHENQLHLTSHSYFEGEEEISEKLRAPKKASWLSEDGLLLWARGFAPPFIKPGERQEVSMLGSAKISRLAHQRLGWNAVEISRAAKTEKIKVASGDFEVERFEVKLENDSQYLIFVEAKAPRKIIRWEFKHPSLSHTAELVGSSRLKYWEMNGDQYRSEVKKLGLKPRPPLTP